MMLIAGGRCAANASAGEVGKLPGMKCLSLVVLVVLLPVFALGELPPGKALAPADLSGFAVFGAQPNHVAVSGQAFDKAIRLEVKERPANPWSAQIGAKTTGPVEKGDVLLMTFWMRTIESRSESGEAAVNAVFEKGAAPHTKSLNQTCSTGREWKQFQLPFAALERHGAGDARIALHLGHGVQTLEVAKIEVKNFAKSVKLSDLPRTRFWYAGREPDAPWRKAAQERIEQFRKADLTITLIDAAGKPVAGAEIDVRMTRHAFGFGSAVAADALLGEGADKEKYRAQVVKLFNRVVLENDLKWPQWEGNRQRAIAAVEWLRGQKIEVRGHNLIWPSWRHLPRDLQNLKESKEALRKRIDDHILETAGAMKGKLVEWDVINEPYSEKDVQKILGDEEMIRWFKLARQADDQAVLFLNDYPILRAGPNPHLDHFEKTIQFLIDGGAPIGGIGVQCHYGSHLPPLTQLLDGLDRFGKFKLPIAATEFDIDTTDEELQAQYMRDHMIAFFSHPSVNSIIMWGFWEGRHWKPNAALYRSDWSAKPCAAAWEDLVLKQWRTNVTVKTDDKGQAKVRGFLGDYEVGVAGRVEKVKLPKSGAGVQVRQ